MVPWQQEAYRIKGEQAKKVLSGNYSQNDVGMVSDYAETMNTDLITAANVINAKHDNHSYLVRKLEQIRIKHQTAIRLAKSRDGIAAIRASMEEDSFFSMLM
jgi:formylmethanofuran dehydrogenase subunit E-like metal-binding protein